MSKSINQVILMGNLTRDPELRTTPSGQSVCSFSLAVNRAWQGQDGQTQEAVDYFDVTAWGKLGELVNQYLRKGRKALVMGRLSQRSWEQEQNRKHASTKGRLAREKIEAPREPPAEFSDPQRQIDQ